MPPAPLRVAVQMDPIDSIDIKGDSTFALMLEAQARGHELFYFQPHTLSMKQGDVTATAQRVQVQNEQGNHFSLSVRETINLRSNVDVVLMRQDPPFDMAYISYTHMLETIHPETLVVNDPAEVRNAPEKLFVTQFNDLTPPTLITRDVEAIREFRHQYKDIIVKPLYGNGGAGVFRISPSDENLNALLEVYEQIYREPIIAQIYLPEVRQGDKRIILVDGKAVGGINRVPAQGEARSNMHVGGRAEKAELTKRDQEICERIGPELKKRGLIFVGIDVIGDYLTEINVTSPTGIQELSRFNDQNIPGMIWDAIEAKRS